MARNNYWVTQRQDAWATQREGSQRAAGIFDTQREAENRGRQILQNTSGGELITQGRDGKIRSKDTINSHDPFPPKDTEN